MADPQSGGMQATPQKDTPSSGKRSDAPDNKTPQPGTISPRRSWWVAAVEVLNVIVATCAIGALLLAVSQNRETSELLKAASGAFKAQAFPKIKFDSYQWIVRPDGHSCEKLAIGFNTYVRNRSGVPVSLEMSDLEVYFAGKIIYQHRASKSKAATQPPTHQGEAILAPDVTIVTIVFQTPEFGNLYSQLQGDAPPPLSFALSVLYRSLVSGERYEYSVKILILEDCRSPNQRNFSNKMKQ